MGIRPKGTNETITLPDDTPQGRWGDWIAGLDEAGEIGGGVISEIDAKAESSNTGTGELAADLTALEDRVEDLEAAPPAHTQPQSSITGLVSRLESIEQRLGTIETRLNALESPPAP